MKRFLMGHFEGSEELSPEKAFERADDRHTVVVLRKEDEHHPEDSLFLPAISDEVLASLVNSATREDLRSVRLLPRIILFRVFGHAERVIGQIAEDYGARRAPLGDVLKSHDEGSVAVFFTALPLKRRVALGDVMNEMLYISGLPYEDLLESLNRRALWYFTEGLEDRQWNETDIRIYDAWGFYMDHYARIRTVFDELEAGFILGEGWGKDHAHILMPVQVYRLRFFSFFPPYIIKELLMGLEYASDGTRLADMDLYSGKSKVSWGGMKDKGRDRQELGLLLREKLLSRLHDETRAVLESQERTLLEKRPDWKKQ